MGKSKKKKKVSSSDEDSDDRGKRRRKRRKGRRQNRGQGRNPGQTRQTTRTQNERSAVALLDPPPLPTKRTDAETRQRRASYLKRNWREREYSCSSSYRRMIRLSAFLQPV